MNKFLKRLMTLVVSALLLATMATNAFASDQSYKVTVYKDAACTKLVSQHAQDAFIGAEKTATDFKVITHKKISGPPPFSWMKGDIESLNILNLGGQGNIQNMDTDPRVFIFNYSGPVNVNKGYKAVFKFSVGVIHPSKTVYLKFTPR